MLTVRVLPESDVVLNCTNEAETVPIRSSSALIVNVKILALSTSNDTYPLANPSVELLVILPQVMTPPLGSVIVLPFITATSPIPGTTPPSQLEPVFQSPAVSASIFAIIHLYLLS